MGKIAVLTDTPSDLRPDLAEERGIYLLPLYINIEGKYYQDQFGISTKEVNERNRTHPDLFVKTSLPSPGDILNIYEKIHEDGFNQLIYITIGTNLSSTYNTAKMMAEDYEEMDIAIIDSGTGSMGEGLLAVYAKDLVDSGAEFLEVVEKVQKASFNTRVYARLSTTKNLKVGGRMGLAAKAIGRFSDPKPIMKVTKSRSIHFVRLNVAKKNGVDELEALMREKLGSSKNYYLALGHGGYVKGLEALRKKVPDIIEGAKFFTEIEISPVISAHIGDGPVGFFYLIAD